MRDHAAPPGGIGMTQLRVALIQQSCSDSREDNLAKTAGMIRQAASTGAQLVVLQELHTSTYFCQVESPALFDLAESIPGPSTETTGEAGRRTGGGDRGVTV